MSTRKDDDARVAVITGASSGLGRALALRLAVRGAHVIATARRTDELERLVEEAARAGGRVTALQADVQETATLIAALLRVDAQHGPVDLVVANAGVGGTKSGLELRWEDCEGMLRTNVLGAVATLTALLPAMVARGRGHLVGISSLAAYRGLPTSSVYSASKAALSTFLEGLRVDLRRSGVAVTDVRPGFVRTPIQRGDVVATPFLMEIEQAVQAIVRAIDERKAIAAFPFPLAQTASASRLLPRALYDVVASRLNP